jgi:hypothetical protein
MPLAQRYHLGQTEILEILFALSLYCSAVPETNVHSSPQPNDIRHLLPSQSEWQIAS